MDFYLLLCDQNLSFYFPSGIHLSILISNWLKSADFLSEFCSHSWRIWQSSAFSEKDWWYFFTFLTNRWKILDLIYVCHMWNLFLTNFALFFLGKRNKQLLEEDGDCTHSTCPAAVHSLKVKLKQRIRKFLLPIYFFGSPFFFVTFQATITLLMLLIGLALGQTQVQQVPTVPVHIINTC